MRKIRIRNLRSLKDTGEVEIKPLTVLVGKNSSGKSTFLRFFPLMKQTIETRTHEPILWYSPRYVDFGSFDESMNRTSEDKTMEFEFEFDILAETLFFPYYRRTSRLNKVAYASRAIYRDSEEMTLKVHMELGNEIEAMTFQVEGQSFSFSRINQRQYQLVINEQKFDEKALPIVVGNDILNFLPRIVFEQPDELRSCDEHFGQLLHNEFRELFSETRHLGRNDSAAFEEVIDKAVDEIVSTIQIGTSNRILESLKRVDDGAVPELVEKLRNLTPSEPLFKKIQILAVGLYIDRIMILSNQYIQQYFSSVRYIAPVRASAERYYRVQGLSVDEIDPRGENIPMVLHHMQNRDKHQLNSWLHEHFGFELESVFIEGHTSLKIKYANGVKVNLADTGFGYSQILPIIIVLWQSTKSNRRREGLAPNFLKQLARYDSQFTIAIEQPELHLHPALQALLIDAFVKVINMCRANQIDIRIIIETHSDAILNRIGYLIAKKYQEFNHDLVNVLIFDNEDNSYVTEVRQSGYNNDGLLVKWPIGFFTPEGV